MGALDRQVGGTHYKHFAIQPAEYAYRNNLNALATQIVKYASRAGLKGGREGLRDDLHKIIHYAELWLEFEGLTNGNTESEEEGG